MLTKCRDNFAVFVVVQTFVSARVAAVQLERRELPIGPIIVVYCCLLSHAAAGLFPSGSV